MVKKGSHSCRGQGEVGAGGGGEGDGIEIESCISADLELRLQPAELTEYWCDVYACRCTGYRIGCTVCTPLEDADSRRTSARL